MDIEHPSEEAEHYQPRSREAWETPQLQRLPLGDAEGSNSNTTVDLEAFVS